MVAVDTSAALFRAANLSIMDYPFEAALFSALSVCDEAVVVVGQSEDDTVDRVRSLADLYPGRVTVHQTTFHYDRGWQERWWDLAASLTDAEWLMYHDADEVLHENDVPAIREQMDNPDVYLISFPLIHFWMTSAFQHVRFPPRATRLGRRSAGWRMRNWCTDEFPNRPACQMVFGPDERSAHGYGGPEIVDMDTPIYHYSWCRDATALQISQAKHVDWYRDGRRFGLTDGRIPEVQPYSFHKHMPSLWQERWVRPYQGGHPAAVQDWLDEHTEAWMELNREARVYED